MYRLKCHLHQKASYVPPGGINCFITYLTIYQLFETIYIATYIYYCRCVALCVVIIIISYIIIIT